MINSRHENCTPIHVTRNGLLLVWTGQQQHHPRGEEVENPDYSCAPLETVGCLIKEIATRDGEGGDFEESSEFQWWLGARCVFFTLQTWYRHLITLIVL